MLQLEELIHTILDHHFNIINRLPFHNYKRLHLNTQVIINYRRDLLVPQEYQMNLHENIELFKCPKDIDYPKTWTSWAGGCTYMNISYGYVTGSGSPGWWYWTDNEKSRHHISLVKNPAEMIVLAESNDDESADCIVSAGLSHPTQGLGNPRHSGGLNVFFWDGHVGYYKLEEILKHPKWFLFPGGD